MSSVEQRLAEQMAERMKVGLYGDMDSVIYGVTPSTATQSQEPPEALTYGKLQELIDSVSDPVEVFMKKKGCDPKDGWKMILPISYREHMPAVSRHIEYCKITPKPLFINPKELYPTPNIWDMYNVNK